MSIGNGKGNNSCKAQYNFRINSGIGCAWKITHLYVCIVISVGIAVLVPHLDLLISLIGAFASCALALMLPPIIDILTLSVEEGEQLSWSRVLKNVLIVVFGFLGFVTGTYSALSEIIKKF